MKADDLMLDALAAEAEVVRGLQLREVLRGRCDVCAGTSFALVELGYTRETTVTFDDLTWHGYTDGWDDMSESGTFEFLVCQSCDEVYESPGIDDWD